MNQVNANYDVIRSESGYAGWFIREIVVSSGNGVVAGANSFSQFSIRQLLSVFLFLLLLLFGFKFSEHATIESKHFF